jgi:hypothetical protein
MKRQAAAFHLGAGVIARKQLSLPSMARHGAISRSLLTAVLFASWNVATTHCAFIAATNLSVSSTSKHESNECPMHSKTNGESQPGKKNGCAELPCCKNLLASKPVNAPFSCKWVTSPLTLDYVSSNASHLEVNRPTQLGSNLDTGPPDYFVELVLQQSIPAHAPPRA